jgi:tetratricopeptide (TPR) repeat protein
MPVGLWPELGNARGRAVAALEEAIYELAGAGLLMGAEAFGVVLPRGAVLEGDAFVGYLSQHGEWTNVARLATILKQDIKTEAQRRSWSEAESEGHVRAAIRQLDLARPTASEMQAALATKRDAPGANAIVARALAKATSDRTGGWSTADVASTLLERLLTRLLEMSGFIRSLEPASRQFVNEVLSGSVDPEPAPEPAPAAVFAPEPAPDGGSVAELSEIGLSPERSRDLVRLGEESRIRRILADGIKPRLIARLGSILDRRCVPTADFVARLQEMTAAITDLQAALQKPSNEEAETRKRRLEAAAALADGDLERAERLLKDARRLIRDGRRRTEERLREEIAGLNRQLAAEAEATAELAGIRAAERDHLGAAELYGEAADSMPRDDRLGAARYLIRQAEALLRHGEEAADRMALEEAQGVGRRALELAPRGEAPALWIDAQLLLARALQMDGVIAGTAPNLRGAIEAYRAGLEALGIGGDRQRRSCAYLGLGDAEFAIGEQERDAAAFPRALESYRRALAESSREAAAGHWARCHLAIGRSLLTIAETEPETPLPAETKAAFEAALGVFDRRRNAREWLEAQAGLGSALLAEGERSKDLTQIEAAAAAFKEVVRGCGPEAGVIRANASMSLADAEAAAGELTHDAGRLEAAAAAYRRAIDEFDDEGSDVARAVASLNLGSVLVRLGERRGDPRRFAEARKAMAYALATFEAARLADYAAIARRNLDSLVKTEAGPRPKAAAHRA